MVDGDRRERDGLREWIGRVVGAIWALPVAGVSLVRRSRMFHPRGSLFDAHVTADPASPWPDVARALEGHALVRLSGALFKREVRRFEVLGAALRISSSPIMDATPSEGDQDLTFATILSPLTMPFAPLTTRSDDYLANRYFGVAPFALHGVGRVKLRLRPTDPPRRVRGSRGDAIASAVAQGGAIFVLEARPTLRFGWKPMCRVVLESESPVDQEALRFDPFRDGRGITPVGFVHAIRRAVYRASQSARPVGARSAQAAPSGCGGASSSPSTAPFGRTTK